MKIRINDYVAVRTQEGGAPRTRSVERQTEDTYLRRVEVHYAGKLPARDNGRRGCRESKCIPAYMGGKS